jgi:1-acyl-sn-glycerol-3-phosphate acyltransferase
MTVLRSAAFNLYFFALTFLLGLFWGIPLRIVAPGRVIGLARFWARLTLAGLRAICGIRFEVVGAEHLPAAGPALIASQHQSAFDTLVWLLLVPWPAYVVKQELARVPLFGPLLRPGGQILVDRSAGAAALRGMVSEARAAAASGRQVVIFPEGTRTAPDEARPLQPGIAALASGTGLPLVPVATDSGRHWGRRAFRKQAGTIHLVIGNPIDPALPRRELLEAVRRAWRSGRESLASPGDNSVSEASAELRGRVSSSA